MNSIYKFFLVAGLLTCFFASCDDEYGARKESTPVFESASVSPASFHFGDSVTLNVTVADPATTLTTLSYEVVAENRVIASGHIPVDGERAEVVHPILVPLLSDQPDGAEVSVNLTIDNILKGTASTVVTGLTGNRPVYNQLYLVTDNGSVAVLKAQSGSKDKYEATELAFDSAFSFKIAEKINNDNTVDYSGAVYGNVNGRLAMIDEKGESAFVYTPNAEITRSFVYDNYAFSVNTSGGSLGANDWSLSAFADDDVFGETFRTLNRTLENGQTYLLVGALADGQNVYNPDFFERVADNRVKFLGETGAYTVYYNPVRKNIFVGVENPAYPQYLLACGYGLGYPTKVTTQEIGAVYAGHTRVHTDWGFGHVMNYVLFRRVSEGVYQGTFFTPGDHDHYAGFKPFENTGWGNEKKAGDFTFTGEQIITGDNDWTIPNDGEITPSANYRFTINLNTNTVHVEQVTL
ncbi:hypothetical protein [Parabacteroides sp. PF5-9]|uniref:hypothetical protein n=1 Tax=Parabacteroides sp. PF5-9 TaxID=1742404 RepID=UPI002475169F|nr:hypothetical protein [Parabacteroides sp. PF5-9]MDH6358842.1 hypothetical protein [Parabacteroides sp. PF5-9]